MTAKIPTENQPQPQLQNQNESGLLENPHLEQELAQQKQTTLEAIKEDTGAIKQAIYQFGGKALEQAKRAEQLIKGNHKTTQGKHKENQKLLSALQKGIVLSPKAEKALKQHQQQSQTPAQTQSQAVENAGKNAKRKEKTTASLPNDWQRDSQGRIRDKQGKFVKAQQLNQYGLGKNAPKDAKETEKDAQDRRILEALSGIKEELGDTEHLDPIVDASKELASPIKAMFGFGKAGTEVIGRGMGKIFSKTQTAQTFRPLLGFFRRKAKNDEKKQNKVIDLLNRIWRKEDGKGRGFLAKLFFPLMLLPKLLTKLFLSFFQRGLLGKLGGLFGSMLTKLMGGFGKFAKGGFFASLGKLSKGLLRRIPILGSLLAIGDGALGLFDDSKDENGQSNRGKRIGGALGTIIGGALGSFFGPIGTVIGAMLGDVLGEKIGAWLAPIDWAKIGEYLTQTWGSLTNWLGNSWDNTIVPAWQTTTDWIGKQWDRLVENLGKIWQEIKQGILNLVPDWFKDGVSGTIEKTKEVGTAIWHNVSNSTQKALNNTSQWINNAWHSVSSFFTTETENQTQTNQTAQTNNENIQHNNPIFANETQNSTAYINDEHSNNNISTNTNTVVENLISEGNIHQEETSVQTRISAEYQSRILDYLGNILTHLGDLLALWKERILPESVNPGFAIDEQGYPNQNLGLSPSLDYQGNDTIADFSQDETGLYLNSVIAKESKGNAQAVNSFGYLGLYQMGAAALADSGMIKREKYDEAVKKYGKDLSSGRNAQIHKSFLENPANWNISGGQQAFLSSKSLQDQAMISFTNKNAKTLANNGVFGGNTAHKQGILLAAHLKGTGGAIDFIKTGKNSVDGYGTSVKSYYEHGKKQYLAYQTQKKQPQSKPNQVQPQTETDKTEAMFANHHLGQETPLIQEAAHYVIPALNIAQTVALDYKNIKNELNKAQKTVQVQVQQKTENSKTQSTQKVEMSSSVDPIYQFLTQDVSERRIAHIVTGGLLRPNKLG